MLVNLPVIPFVIDIFIFFPAGSIWMLTRVSWAVVRIALRARWRAPLVVASATAAIAGVIAFCNHVATGPVVPDKNGDPTNNFYWHMIFMVLLPGIGFVLDKVAGKPKPKPKPEDDPHVSIDASVATTCPNETVTLTGSGTPEGGAYNWSSAGSPSTTTNKVYEVRFPADEMRRDEVVSLIYTLPNGREATATATITIRRASGAGWAAQFPQSNLIADLDGNFGQSVQRFIDAVAAQGAAVNRITTFRPRERSYLMHYSWRVSRPPGNAHRLDPQDVPALAGVEICWVHRNAQGEYDDGASRQAAQAMVAEFGIDPANTVPPAYPSRHNIRLAADIRITWAGPGPLMVTAGNGQVMAVNGPGGSTNPDLIAVAATFGVIHLDPPAADPNHWSDNGH